MPNMVDSKTLEHKNSIPLEPYLKWVWTRAQSLMMPYPYILPAIAELLPMESGIDGYLHFMSVDVCKG